MGLDADTAWQFADVISRSGPVPVTLVAPASSAAAGFPEAELLNASVSEPQHLDHVGIDITVQRLEHAAYMQITTALKVSGQPAHPAEGPWQDVPDEPDRTAQPQPPVSEDLIAPTSSSLAAARDVSSEAFPALVMAATDPSGLRLLPAAIVPAQDHNEPGPDTEAAFSAAADSTTGSSTVSCTDMTSLIRRLLDHRIRR
uniref:Uncharacterized protein n=1 Tax=Streptomyces sp. NBC_00180 TaxID=2903632 RepID=A0AAU1IA43_9ACTN